MFLIMAGDYDEKRGGVVALHLLCHLLNTCGYEAFICPMVSSQQISPVGTLGGLGRVCKAWLSWHLKEKSRELRSEPGLITPLCSRPAALARSRKSIVVYPEIVFGNPLWARHVVRWFLHHPGYHAGATGINRDELHVRYSEWQRLPNIEWCHQYPTMLRPFKIPDCYRMGQPSEARQGSAHCLRKGSGRELVNDLTGSVLIDNLSHAETAEVFRTVKTFVSYDLYTAYSLFAVLCGTDSVVVPDEKLLRTDWLRSEEERWGIAYGFDDVARARETAHLQRNRLHEMQQQSRDSVQQFAKYAIKHFA